MTEHGSLYYSQLEATAGGDTARATVRDRHELELDEPSWSNDGDDRAPCPVDYLLVGVAGCQLESIRHCMDSSRVEDYQINASVEGEYAIPADSETGVPEPMSNALTAIHLSVEIATNAEDERRAKRCLDIAEERGCIVSRSVDGGVDVPLSTSVHIRADAGD